MTNHAGKPCLFSSFNLYTALILLCLLWLNALSAQAESQKTYHRIVSLAPSITEMIYSAGAGDQLVGVINYSNYPKAALKLPIIGDYNQLNYEAIMALKPDLIIAWQGGNQTTQLNKLQQLGLETWEIGINNIEDIPQKITELAKKLALNNRDPLNAFQYAASLQTELENIKRNYAEVATRRVFYQLWHRPMITINNKQFIGQAISLCGASNIFADLPLLSSEVNLETVLQRNPEVILVANSDNTQSAQLEEWKKWQHISAVQHQRVHAVDADIYQRPTARFIMGLSKLCETIYE